MFYGPWMDPRFALLIKMVHKIDKLTYLGSAIVGSFDGNRVWGKELLSSGIKTFSWSPDAKSMLILDLQGQFHLLDSNGNIKVRQYTKV
jgi:hypothetical protein